MSWQLFNTQMSVFDGKQHTSLTNFPKTLAAAYHGCVMRHFDMMTGGGVIMNADAKVTPLYQQIQAIHSKNIGGHSGIHWLQQYDVAIKNYWAGLTILGATGTVMITYPGEWTALYLRQNLNFKHFLQYFQVTARTHMMTVAGTYVSFMVPNPYVGPWSGAFLQTIP